MDIAQLRKYCVKTVYARVLRAGSSNLTFAIISCFATHPAGLRRCAWHLQLQTLQNVCCRSRTTEVVAACPCNMRPCLNTSITKRATVLLSKAARRRSPRLRQTGCLRCSSSVSPDDNQESAHTQDALIEMLKLNVAKRKALDALGEGTSEEQRQRLIDQLTVASDKEKLLLQQEADQACVEYPARLGGNTQALLRFDFSHRL